jgi:hypothetical protein
MAEYQYGIVSGSGGRWGVQKRHAVKEGSVRKLRFGHSAESLCGQVVTPMSERKFNPDDQHSCKRCSKAVKQNAA